MNKLSKKIAGTWQDRVRALPQFKNIDTQVSDLWMERASDMDDEDRERLISYMGRLNADDMGAMIADKRKRWHPHTTPANVVRTKLLRERPKNEPAYKARRRLMMPIAMDMFHRQIAQAGAIPRRDLALKVLEFDCPEHPWLSLTAADFIEDNGRIILVEYRTPSEPMSLSTRGMAFHHEVSMHYALLAARKAGIQVNALRLCALDAKAWSVETVDLPIDESMVSEIQAEGDRIWNEHILSGVIIPQVAPQGVVSLDDLRKPSVGAEGSADLLTTLADRFLTYGVAGKECENEREILQREAGDLLPVAALPLEVERVDAGGVRFRINRNMDVDGLHGLALDLLMNRSGYCKEDAEAVLDHPNYWSEAEYSAHGLMQAIETHFDVDPTKDPRFSVAISKPARRRVDTLLDLVRSLDPDDTINLQEYVRDAHIRMEMVPPRARFEREQRAQASAKVKGMLGETLNGVSMQPAPVPEAPRRGSRRP